MELLDRYLDEVRRRLPKETRDDICDDLRSRLDRDIAARGGASPSEADVIAVLEAFGPPHEVAASSSGGRYLIGPRLYPQFVTTLRIVITALAVIVALGFLVSLVSGGAGSGGFTVRIASLLNSLLDSAITALGIVVIVFALLERLDLEIALPGKEKSWHPKDLPAATDVDLVGRFDSIAGIVFPAVILMLLNRFKYDLGISVEPDGKLLFNDVLLDNLPWLNASLILPIVLNVWLFWSARWNWPSRLAKIAIDCFSVYVFYRIAQGVIAARADIEAAGLPAPLATIAIRIAELAPFAVGLVVAIEAGTHIYKGWKSSR